MKSFVEVANTATVNTTTVVTDALAIAKSDVKNRIAVNISLLYPIICLCWHCSDTVSYTNHLHCNVIGNATGGVTAVTDYYDGKA